MESKNIETKKAVNMDEMKQAVTRQALTMLAALEAGNAFEAMSASVNLSAKLIASVAATRPDDPQEWTAAVIELLQLRIFTETYTLVSPAVTAESAAPQQPRKEVHTEDERQILKMCNLQGVDPADVPAWVIKAMKQAIRHGRLQGERGKSREGILTQDRLFAGVYPTGISYADREQEEHGDYKRRAFLYFDTLELTIYPGCPEDLRERIIKDASTIQAKAGELYPISTSGQTVLLGSKMEKEA